MSMPLTASAVSHQLNVRRFARRFEAATYPVLQPYSGPTPVPLDGTDLCSRGQQGRPGAVLQAREVRS